MAEDLLAVNIDGALWAPYKDLYRIVNSAISKKDYAGFQELESAMRTYRIDFERLLKNPPRRVDSGEAVKRATSDGIRILGQHGRRVLSQAVIEETLILANLFDMNEVVALEFLLMGECHQPRLYATSRGLAAVLLYYDGRRCLVNSLRTLVQARDGRCWTLALPAEVSELVTRFTTQLWDHGTCQQILGHLDTFTVEEEQRRLESGCALGNAKHRRNVLDMVREIRSALAESVYCYACQSGLSRVLVLRLLDTLAESLPARADGAFDDVQMFLLMALLYSIDLDMLSPAEEVDDQVQNVPLAADEGFVAAVHKELSGSREWKCPPLKAAVQFAWAISLRTLSFLPSFQGERQQYIEEDETLVDEALERGALSFLCTMVVANPHFQSEEYFVRRIHGIVTHFLVFMPLRVKELRNRGDEVARIMYHNDANAEDLAVPPLHFRHLLQLVAGLYARDTFGLELNNDYWCSSEIFGQLYSASANFLNPTQKQVNLFKFVRLAGNLLPPLLYIPYINMLSSLSGSPSGAHNCFNLLKSNGSVPGGPYGSISWDHFFLSLHRYFACLRQEAQSAPGQPRGASRGITPQEVEGLAAILKLVQTVSRHDELSRLALCASPEWTPIQILLGLLSCAVPVALKAELVLTLRALIKSEDVAVSLWQSLESSRFLPTATSGEDMCSVQMELEEVESFNEEYPMTRAILQLLLTLADFFQPVDTSGEYMLSRFDPCVVYTINTVFFKFHIRAYKSVEEKWQVASLCLEFLLKLLMKYEPSVHQLPSPDGNASVISAGRIPSGHFVMASMIQDSPLIKTILYVIDKVTSTLDQYLNHFPGQVEMEKCALLCLRLMHVTFEKQESFISLVRDNNLSLNVVGLDQLLMGVSARTGRPDYLVKIVKFISFNGFLPDHAFYSSCIISCMCSSAISQSAVFGTFAANQDDLAMLRQSVVECLEADDQDEDSVSPEPNNTVDNQSLEGSQVRGSTRRTLLRLLIQGVRQQAPNLSLFLLGFDHTKNPHKSVLQDPGVLGSPYNCLHTVLEILFRSNGCSDSALTAELCQQLIYTLSVHADTSEPTLRFLRSSHDFLFRQIKLLPFEYRKSEKSMSDTYALNRQTWLLRTAATELRVSVASGQRSSLQRLVHLLIDDRNPATNTAHTTSGQLGGGVGHTSAIDSDAGFSRSKLLAVLDELELSAEMPSPPVWDVFDAAVVRGVIAACERPARTPPWLPGEARLRPLLAVDLRRLHALLASEVNSAQSGISLAQRPAVQRELHSILEFVARRNRVHLQLHAKRQALEAWRQVLEMVVATAGARVLEEHRRVTVLLELAHTFLRKVLDEDVVAELVDSASSVLPTLLTSLRQCFAGSGAEVKTTILDMSSLGQSPTQPPSWTPYASSLEVVLHGIIGCILKAGAGPQKVRSNYYSALLSLLKICRSSHKEGNATDDCVLDLNVSSKNEQDSEKFLHNCVEIIHSYGHSCLDVLCRDACSTNHITKMLALCCLSVVIANDRRQTLVHFMTSKGYIKDFVNSIKTEDAQLCLATPMRADNVRALYVYETKMAFFAEFACVVQGAQVLMSCGLLEWLADMQCYDVYPDTTRNLDSVAMEEEAGPWFSPANYFHHILVPALKLCLLILVSPTASSQDAKSLVARFLAAHADTISFILRDHDHSEHDVKELSFISAIYSRIVGDIEENFVGARSGASSEALGQMMRLRRQVKLLLPNLLRAKRTQLLHPQSFVGLTESGAGSHQSSTGLAWIETVANLLAFHTNSIQISSGTKTAAPQLFFSPNIGDDGFSSSLYADYSMTSSRQSKVADMGLLVFLLKHATQEFFTVLANHQLSAHKRSSQQLLAGDVWQHVTDHSLDASVTNSAQQQDLSSHIFKLLFDIVEHTLFILWFHLDFYLLRCGTADVAQGRANLRRLQDSRSLERLNPSGDQTDRAGTKLLQPSREELDLLKTSCKSIFNETLFEKITEIGKFSEKAKRSRIVTVLIRRLRRLIFQPND